MRIAFKGKSYEVIFTEHARAQMSLREISEDEALAVIKTGEAKAKAEKKFWVFKKMRGRNDNLICLSISLEDPNLIVITAMVNWRPK